MSYQYINPYQLNNNAQMQNLDLSKIQAPSYFGVQNPYQVNSFQTSLYNTQNLQFPYNNPNFSPSINSKYYSLGTIKAPDGSNIHLFQLLNGQKVAIMPKKNQATIVKTFLNGGSMNENDKIRGISHCIEHSLFKGTNKLKDGDVFKMTGAMGATTNASTDWAQTDYYISAPYMNESNLAKTIEIQGDMISTPKFNQQDIKDEITGAVCSEISMMGDNPLSLAQDKVIRNLYQINSNSSDMVAGSISTVSSLDSNDLKQYYQKHYTPDSLYTVVVGDVDVDKTMDMITNSFNVVNPNNQTKTIQQFNPISKSTRQDLISSKTNSTYLLMAFDGPKPTDTKGLIIADLVGQYLSNCSTSELKKGLDKTSGQYYSEEHKFSLNPNDGYAILGTIELSQNNEQQALDLYYDTISDLQKNGISQDDLKAIKQNRIKSFELGMSSSSTICDMIGSGFLDKSLKDISQYKTILENITTDDIKQFLNQYYDLNKVSIVALHPKTVTNDEINSRYNSSKYSMQNSKQKQMNMISFCGSKENKPITTDDIEECMLENNTHVAFAKNKSDICAFTWSVDTQPIKPKNSNIPAVINYIFSNGDAFKSFEREKELNGIDSNVFVNGKKIEISANCLSANSSQTLEIMKKLLYQPNFTQQDFEEAKRYVKDCLQTSQKDGEQNLLDKLYPGYFPTDKQKLEEIDNLTLDDIKSFYNELLKSSQSHLTATLPENNYEALRNDVINANNPNGFKFQHGLSGFAPIYSPNKKDTVICDTDDLNQATIYKTYTFPLSGNIDDEVKFEMLNEILGGSANARLFADLREKQKLAYSVYSSIYSFENSGMLTLDISTMTDNPTNNAQSYDNVKKSLEGFKKHTDKLCKEYVTDEELQTAKEVLKQRVIGTFQNPLRKNDYISMNIKEPYGLKRIDKYLEAIDKVTKDDILKSANFIFSQHPTISIVASENTINSQMDYLMSQGEIKKAS